MLSSSGMGTFLGLPKWHQGASCCIGPIWSWRIAGDGRAPGMGPLGELGLVDRGDRARIEDLHEQRAGCIYIHAVTQLEISLDGSAVSSSPMDVIRGFLMPDPVRKLILEANCYSKHGTT